MEVLAVDDDDLLGAAEDVESPLQNDAEIARQVEAVRPDVGLRRRQAAVAGEQEVRRQADLAIDALLVHRPSAQEDPGPHVGDGGARGEHRLHLRAHLGMAARGLEAVRPAHAVARLEVPPDHQRSLPAGAQLGHGEHRLGHGVASQHRPLAHPVDPVAFLEGDRVGVPAGFRAGDPGPHRAKVAAGHGPAKAGVVAKGEVGHPADAGGLRLDHLQEPLGGIDPVERIHDGQGGAAQQRQQEAGHQAHVVIERQPGGDADGTAAHRLGHGRPVAKVLARQSHAADAHRLLDAGGPGAVLPEQGIGPLQGLREQRPRPGPIGGGVGQLREPRQDQPLAAQVQAAQHAFLALHQQHRRRLDPAHRLDLLLRVGLGVLPRRTRREKGRGPAGRDQGDEQGHHVEAGRRHDQGEGADPRFGLDDPDVTIRQGPEIVPRDRPAPVAPVGEVAAVERETGRAGGSHAWFRPGPRAGPGPLRRPTSVPRRKGRP